MKVLLLYTLHSLCLPFLLCKTVNKFACTFDGRFTKHIALALPQPLQYTHISVAQKIYGGECLLSSFFAPTLFLFLSPFVSSNVYQRLQQHAKTARLDTVTDCAPFHFVILCSVSFRFVLTFFSVSFFPLSSSFLLP